MTRSVPSTSNSSGYSWQTGNAGTVRSGPRLGAVDADGAVVAGAGEALAVRGPRHAGDAQRVALERQDFPAPPRVPHLHGLVGAGAGDAFAVGRPRHAHDLARVALQRADLFPRARVVDLQGLVGAGADDAPAVGRPRHARDLARVALQRADRLAR